MVTLNTFTDSGMLEAKYVSSLPQRLVFNSNMPFEEHPLDASVLQSLGDTIDLRSSSHIAKVINNTDFNLWVSSIPIFSAEFASDNGQYLDSMEYVLPHSAVNLVFLTATSNPLECTLFWKLDNYSCSTGLLKYFVPVDNHPQEFIEASLTLQDLPINFDGALRVAELIAEYRIPSGAITATYTNLQLELGIFVIYAAEDGNLQLCLSSSVSSEQWNLESAAVDGPIKISFSNHAEESSRCLQMTARFFRRGLFYIGPIYRKNQEKWRICSEIHILHVE